MRFAIVVLFICFSGANAVGQCPIQPRRASFDASGKNVTIHYYNSSTRPVRDVQFILTEDTGPRPQSVVGNFSARGIVHPQQERVAVFPQIGGMAFDGPVELEVKRVSFADRSTWAAPHNNPCKVLFAER
jgi:hypothetical protein